MKKLFILLLLMSYNFAFSNPGDTTWVTAYQNRKLTQYGSIDTTVAFPNNLSTNKVLMYLTIGRYACPGNPQYCGSWDYGCNVILKPQAHDTMLIGKYITPYAGNWNISTDKHEYIIDVTDYAKYMNGPQGLMFHYAGYSWGFTLKIRFAFIEGTPYQNVLNVKPVYKWNYYTFGNVPGQIENLLNNKAVSTGSNVSRSIIKNFVTGHGSDNGSYCAEFCPMTYSLFVNNSQVASKQIWRDNCGYNQLSPQSGTWVYDRGNWCPGDISYPYIHNISSVINSNSNYTMNIDMPNYANASGQAGYDMETQFITYSAPTFSNDVGIEWIYNPSMDDDAVRDNPTCSQPRILIKNYGGNNLTNAIVTYSINGTAGPTFTWTGNLAFLDTASMWLPGPSTIFPAPNTTNNSFVVNVTTANDQNPYNNKMYSKFATSTQYSLNRIVINLITNSATGTNFFNETKWYLYDESNNLVASRTNPNNNTNYNDTVVVSNGCYKLVVNDEGCDGLSWWANQGAGNGSIKLKNDQGVPIKYYNGDFGCQLIDRFSINNSITSVKSNDVNDAFEVFPNPFNNNFNIRFMLSQSRNVSMRVLSIDGRVLMGDEFSNVMDNTVQVNASELSKGVYFVEMNINGSKTVSKLIRQ